jgi:hypothetical protein
LEDKWGICWIEKVCFSNTNNKLINEVGYANEKTKETKQNTIYYYVVHPLKFAWVLFLQEQK